MKDRFEDRCFDKSFLLKVYSKSYKEYFEFSFEYKVRKSPVETTSRYLRNTCNYLLKFVAFNE